VLGAADRFIEATSTTLRWRADAAVLVTLDGDTAHFETEAVAYLPAKTGTPSSRAGSGTPTTASAR
jgi:hypothetical protein